MFTLDATRKYVVDGHAWLRQKAPLDPAVILYFAGDLCIGVDAWRELQGLDCRVVIEGTLTVNP